jgi:hypothetical protein
MNSQATGLKVAAIIFALFALGHVVRLFKHAKVMVATHQIPMAGELGGSDHCRTEHLDVATLFPQPLTFL